MPRDLEPLFFPRSVAVVGASSRSGSLGGAVLANLVHGGFSGPIYPVHPTEARVADLPVYPGLNALPDTPDMAVWCVSPAAVETGIPELLAMGTRAFVVLTAGFGELGPDGGKREAALARQCREHGAVMLGPNCLGLHVSKPESPLHASFSRVRPAPGKTILLSQSGSITEWLLLRMNERGLGTMFAASLGNMADLDIADLLSGAARCFPESARAFVYLQNDADAERLRAAAAQLPETWRLLVLRGAVKTTALPGDGNVRAVGSLTETVDTIEAMDRLGKAQGNRVAIVSNAGGPALLAAQTLRSRGVELPRLSSELQARLRPGLAAAAMTENPVDLLATGQPQAFGHALAEIDASGEVDAMLIIFMHPVMIPGPDMTHALRSSLAGRRCPVLVCWLGTSKEIPALREAGLAVVPEPTRAAKALSTWASF